MSGSSSSSASINALLKKTEHYDKDERYMATSDLCEVIKRYASGSSYEGYGKIDATTERRICAAVLSLLKDKSNDVQAVAVKTLGVLLTTVQEEQVLEIADSLTDQVLDQSKSELRDVYAIGLRTLCKTVPAPMGDHVSQRLVSRLLEGMANSDDEIILACLDILTDLLSRFGATAASLTHQHESILQMCLQQLNSDSHLIRKRAGNAIGCLSGVLSDTLLVRMVESLLSQIEVATSNKGDTRALIRTMCAVSGVVGHRLGQMQIDRILPIFLSFCQPDEAQTGDDDDDHMEEEEDNHHQATSLQNEVRESCFNGFESFVLKSPTEVEPHLAKIIQAALAYMSYDPNYSYGDDEEEEDQDDDEDEYDDEDEFEDDDDDDDEDDDDSWKVRRAAIRALTAVVESKKHNPSLLWNKVYEVRRERSTTVASALVGRFKEREENCRVDVIDSFTKLLSVTVAASVSGDVSFASETEMDTTESGVVIDFRAKYANALVKACEKLLSGKKGGDRSKSSALSLLSTLCRAPGGVGGDAKIAGVFEHVKTFLSDGGTSGGLTHHTTVSKGLKLEALSLVRVMLSCNMHDPVHVKQGLHKMLLDDLCLAVKERWYKVIAEALRVLTEVPKFFVVGYTGSEDEAAKKVETSAVATTLYEAIEPLLAASDVDQEIKECALAASAALLSALHNSLTQEQMGRMLSLLLEKLRNETTRIAAIKTLSTIASASDEDSMNDNAISLTPILGEAVAVMASFLKQQSRSLKQNSLEALDIVITNHGTEDPTLADGKLFSSVLADLAGLIVDSDLHLSHLSMRVCISTLRVCSASGPAAKEHALPPALVLSTSSLLQEPALDSLLKLLEQMVVSGSVEFAELADLVSSSMDLPVLGKHAVANLAKCVGVITAATTLENRQEVVSDLLTYVEGAGSPTNPAAVRKVVLNLLVSGNLGRVVDYSTMDGVADRIQAIYLGAFDSSSEEIKHAAAYALGRAAIGSQSVLLPAMVSTLENSDQKKQYLLLSAIREFIQCQLKTGGKGLSASIPVILPNLLNHTSDAEEGSRTMVAECLGSLTCVQPTEMLQTLQELVKEHSAISAEGGHITTEGDETSKKNALVCWTAVTSVKHAIAGKASVTDLTRAMPVFLELLKQEEVTVRSAALLMVYSSVHHMPQVVSSFMKESIMPALYDVSQLTLKRIVDLGPFKHTVDDALPMRKSAMSIFATCLEKLPGSMDIAAFMPILAKALGDLEDVQLQAHHIVITASQKYPTYVVAAMENFVPPLETMFMDKTFKKKTANKTGSELERAKEWIKSGLRALLVMSKLEGSLANRRFATLVERVKSDAKFRPMLDAIEEER
mmetsp:Transcript_4617/g.7695  ORF Transcript_4617/g.7695 Transcript_4617/m.7695 type:complete len:1340 (-) Transcript_4617:522-4541(-)